ncbi:MAG: hypothetical protein FJ027_06770 [Candidatus Rokubacteria bacterium]|nr:hypothetical protein [Candidatus Rokubacteria bacterium]
MADLSLQLQADNLPRETIEQLLVEGHWAPILARLQTGENLLLEGCRGVGKTMFMRAASARLAQRAKDGGKVLGVHTTFKRYLATIPPPGSPDSAERGKFKAWVNARILGALSDQVRAVFPDRAHDLGGIVTSVNWNQVFGILETTYRGDNGDKQFHALLQAGLSEAQIPALEGYTFTVDAIQAVRKAFGMDLLVFLLDDAAHALDTRAQGEFFTLIKSLYSEGLAYKISVYPAVTRYGLDFSYGHDAVVVSLGDLPSPNGMEAFFGLLERRLTISDQESPADALIRVLLDQHRDWIRLMVYCSNGNPRGVLKLVSEVLTQLAGRAPAESRYDDVRSAINLVMDRHLDNMVPGVIKDLDPRLLKAAELLLGSFREKISSSPLQGSQPRMFLAVTNSMQIPYMCTAAIKLLVAANVLSASGPARLSQRENGTAYLLNPGFVFRDNVLGSSAGTTVSPERWLQHFDTMSPRIHAEFSRTARLWTDVKMEADREPSARCVNGHPMMEMTGLCEQCGVRALQRGPAEVLLEKDIEVLDLSAALKKRLRESGFTSVRRVFEATPEEIDAIPYVGEARAQTIRSAVEAAVDEFFAG